jgi:PAS domain S-box-containing protein
MGGRVIRGRSQGRAAAGLAQKILAGTPAAALPVAETPTDTVLDYRTLGRFGLSPDNVPAGTLFLNAPVSPYERYKTAIWCGLAILVISLPAAILLAAALAARRRVESRLIESERRYRELVENAHALILRFDATGRLVFVNEYTERLLGYSRKELLGGEVSFWPPAPANLSGLLARAMTAPETLAGNESENMVTARGGRQVFVHWDNRPVLGDDGHPEGWLAVGTDITARRLAEDALSVRVLAEEELSAFGRELLAAAPGDVNRALGHLLTAFGVDRVAWFVNCAAPDIGACCRLVTDVCRPGLDPQTGNPVMERIPYSIDGFRWADILSGGDTISGLVDEFTEKQRHIFAHFGIRTVLAAPVVVNGTWDGFLAVGETRRPHRFSHFEQTLLTTAASLLSAHLSRPCA